jgi:hypothetical protein
MIPVSRQGDCVVKEIALAGRRKSKAVVSSRYGADDEFAGQEDLLRNVSS